MVRSLRRSGEQELSDDGILGRGEFVERVIKEAAGHAKYQLPVKEQHQKTLEIITKICKAAKVSIEELKSGSRRKEISRIRAQIAIELVITHGVSYAEAARHLGVSTSGIAKVIYREK